jgi:hypothetical protein
VRISNKQPRRKPAWHRRAHISNKQARRKPGPPVKNGESAPPRSGWGCGRIAGALPLWLIEIAAMWVMLIWRHALALGASERAQATGTAPASA